MNKPKILIVEDNAIVAEDLRTKLINLGYEITGEATSGEKALHVVSTNPPDIALMDIRLGAGMSGIETAAILKRDFHVSVIYLTAHADDDTIDQAKITEPYGYIVKPFDDFELKSVIEVAVYKQQADRKIRESHKWLQTTLNSIGDGVIATDTEGRVSFLNPVAAKTTGWPDNEAIGRPIEEVFCIINETSRQTEQNPVKKVLETKQKTRLANNTLLISRDGRELPIIDSGAPIADDAGQSLGAVLVFQDDSRARKAKQELLRQKREAERYLNLAGVIFIGLDLEGKITTANTKARRILETAEENIIGLNWFDSFIPENARDEALKVFHQICRGTMEPYDYYEYPVISRSGKQRHVAWHNSYIDDDNGRIIGVLGSGEDITEKLQLQTKLQHALKMESIGTLAGGIAHDFNNILSAILGFTELSVEMVEKGTLLEDNLLEVLAAGIRARKSSARS